jgi:hypothetical protein
MRSFSVRLAGTLGVVMGVLAAGLACAQQTTSNYARATAPPAKKAARPSAEPRENGSIHRIETYSGTRRSVVYLPEGEVSPADRAAAREMQHAENESSYLHDLERVKQQYVSDERILQQQRRAVQQQTYGRSTTSEQDTSNLGGVRYLGGYGLYGGYGGYGLYGVGLPGYGLYGGLGYGSWGAGMGGLAASGHSRVTENQGLQNGVGDEGRLKEALSKAIASEASAEYADQVLRGYEKSLTRAASSPVLAKTLSLRPNSEAAASAEPSYPEKSKVTVWIGGDRYEGVVKADQPAWIVLDTADGELRLRKSSIERSIVHASPKPAPPRTTAAK